MIKKLIISSSLLLVAIIAAGQVSESQINAELLSRGATPEQIAKAKSMAQGQKSSGGDYYSSQNSNDVNRSRVNNGETLAAADSTDAKEGRLIFGHDIFRSRKLSFEPVMSVAVPQTYILGPGDEVVIDVYGASQTTAAVKVAPDGCVNVPKIGPVKVAGLTLEKAQARIRNAMGEHYQGSDIKVDVAQTRAIGVNVMGEVRTPGTYTVSAFASVFHALYLAGGVTQNGTLRDIKLVRNGKIVTSVDVYDYVVNGRLSGNIVLCDGDVIIVGSYVNLVELTGNVKRPMWYELKNGETLESLLGYSGGFVGGAYTGAVSVNRKAGSKLSVYTVENADFASFALMDQDSVSVMPNENRYENSVKIKGAVKRPGQYELGTVKTVRGLVEYAGGLQEYALTSRAVIIRLNKDRSCQTISVDLAAVLDGRSKDIRLMNEDILMVSSLEPVSELRTMSIEGEVFRPGVFLFSENTTVEDIIALAGGLKESASLVNVEVSRRIIDPSATSDSEIKSETFNVRINENLGFGSEPGFILKPYDKVFVRRSPVFEPQQSVNISGEVVFAGNYTLRSNSVRLSEIVANAGGLKQQAYARNARLIRLTDDADRTREEQILDLSQTLTDSLGVIEPEDTYSVAIDLEKAMSQPGSKWDIILRDGDRIIVPMMQNTVRISGAVLYPNNVTYIDGKGANYYINESGGYAKNALSSRAYVVYANGHVSKLSKAQLEPGCEIVIPFKEKKDVAQNVGQWAAIGSSIASISALVITAIATLSN